MISSLRNLRRLPDVRAPKREEGEELNEMDLLRHCLEEYKIGKYSPMYYKESELERGTLIIEEQEDEMRRESDRNKVLGGNKKVENVFTAEEQACEREAKKGMTDDESAFSVEKRFKNRLMSGRINIGLENRDILIAFIPGSNGTNIIKRITTSITLLRKSCKDINLTFFYPDFDR